MTEIPDDDFGGYYCKASWTITELYGIEASMLYGFIYFRSKLKKKYCCESYRNMAKSLHISESTVKRRIKLLKSEGLIKDIKGSKSLQDGDTRWFVIVPGMLRALESDLIEAKEQVAEEFMLNVQAAMGSSQGTGDSSQKTWDSSQKPEGRITMTSEDGHNELESYTNTERSYKNKDTSDSKFSINVFSYLDGLQTDEYREAFKNRTSNIVNILSVDYNNDRLIEELAETAYDFMLERNPNYVEDEGDREKVTRYFSCFIRARLKEWLNEEKGIQM